MSSHTHASAYTHVHIPCNGRKERRKEKEPTNKLWGLEYSLVREHMLSMCETLGLKLRTKN